jgi:predicted phosphodiesterase
LAVLVVSDIHANLAALDAVLDAAPPHDAVWFLGDAVGYGADPNAVVERLAEIGPEVWLAGNHDRAALGLLDLADFNPAARRAAEWTAATLSDAARSHLADRAASCVIEGSGVTLVHGSPRHPLWEYILGAQVAMDNFRHFSTPVCLFGHTHVAAIYQAEIDGALRLPTTLDPVVIPDGARWLVNPGSGGQPRDSDPRASCLIYEPAASALTFHRVSYDVAATQARILAAGLPSTLAARLDAGW